MKKIIFTLATFVMSAVFTTNVMATLTFYTDRADFENTLGYYTIHDFEDDTVGMFTGSTRDFGAFTADDTGASSFSVAGVSDINVTAFGYSLPMDNNFLYNITTGVGQTDTFKLTFNEEVKGFVFDYKLLDISDMTISVGSNSQALSNNLTTFNLDNNFFGVIDDDVLSAGTSTSLNNNYTYTFLWQTYTGSMPYAIGIDNVTYGSGAAPVPEPATMLLFGTGLFGIAGLRRKTAKK